MSRTHRSASRIMQAGLLIQMFCGVAMVTVFAYLVAKILSGSPALGLLAGAVTLLFAVAAVVEGLTRSDEQATE